MYIHRNCDFQLCAHAIGAGNQNRLFVFSCVQFEQRAKTTDASKNSICKRAGGKMADTILRVIRDSNIHSSVGISHGCASAFNLQVTLQSDEGGLATKL